MIFAFSALEDSVCGGEAWFRSSFRALVCFEAKIDDFLSHPAASCKSLAQRGRQGQRRFPGAPTRQGRECRQSRWAPGFSDNWAVGYRSVSAVRPQGRESLAQTKTTTRQHTAGSSGSWVSKFWKDQNDPLSSNKSMRAEKTIGFLHFRRLLISLKG